MATSIIVTLGSVLLLAFVVAGVIVEKRMLRQLSSSSCTGRLWRRAFPTSTKQDIRQFLEIVLSSFGIADSYRLRLAPTVKLMDLYRAVEPPGFSMGVDAMELETFALEIEDRFGVDLFECWKEELTLGDVFTLTQSAGGLTTYST